MSRGEGGRGGERKDGRTEGREHLNLHTHHLPLTNEQRNKEGGNGSPRTATTITVKTPRNKGFGRRRVEQRLRSVELQDKGFRGKQTAAATPKTFPPPYYIHCLNDISIRGSCCMDG